MDFAILERLDLLLEERQADLNQIFQNSHQHNSSHLDCKLIRTELALIQHSLAVLIDSQTAFIISLEESDVDNGIEGIDELEQAGSQKKERPTRF